MLHLRRKVTVIRRITMANLEKEERILLSQESVQAELLRSCKAAALGTLPLLLLLIGMAIFVTAMSVITDDGYRFVGFAVSLLIWGMVLAFLYNVTLRPLTIRRQLAQGLLSLEEDQVNAAVEETKRTSRGHHRQVFVLYLHKYGRVEVGHALWEMLVEGDTVYVAVLRTKKPQVMRVYSILTHRLNLPREEEST